MVLYMVGDAENRRSGVVLSDDIEMFLQINHELCCYFI
jgi:hypothetical protein